MKNFRIFFAIFLGVFGGFRPAHAGWAVSEALPEWDILDSSVIVATADFSKSNTINFPDSIFGNGMLVIDTSGTVYFGTPVKFYSHSIPAGDVGTPFLSVLGGAVKSHSRVKCHLEVGKQKNALICDDFAPLISGSSTSADTAFLSFEIVRVRGDAGKLIYLNYKVRSTNRDIVLSGSGQKGLFWTGFQADTLGSIDSVIQASLHRAPFLMYAGGAGQQPMIHRSNQHGYDWWEVFYIDDTVGPTVQSPYLAINPVNRSEFLNFLVKSEDARNYDSLVVVYKIAQIANPYYSDWLITPFSDTALGNDYASLELDKSKRRMAQCLRGFGPVHSLNANTFPPLDRFQAYHYTVDGSVAETLYVDSVYLTKGLGKSYSVQGFSNSISVQVVGASDSGVKVSLSGCGSRSVFSGTDGLVVFDSLPDGVCLLEFSKPGSIISPSSRVFTLTSNQRIYVQQYLGVPKILQHSISTQQGAVAAIKLDNSWVQDPSTANAWQFTWNLRVIDGNTSLPLRLDPSSQRLILGQSGSSQTGVARFLLTATNPYGASTSDTLTAEIVAVDQAPKIQSINWTVPVNGTLQTRLDSTYKGIGVWAIDPDNSPSSLSWSATILPASKNKATATLQGNVLTLVSGANSLDPVLLKLVVGDFAGKKDSVQVLVPVYKRPTQIYGASMGQTQPAGDLKVDFSSQYALDAVALRNGTVQVFIPSQGKWGAVPADLTVIQSPYFQNGNWVDGVYSISILRASRVKVSSSSTFRLDSALQTAGSAQVRVPWASGGDTGSFLVTTQTRFAGPLGTIAGSFGYTVGDSLQRSPNLNLSWSWRPAPRSQTLQLFDGAGVLVQSLSLDLTSTGTTIVGLKDFETYRAVLLGTDSLGNTSSATWTGRSTSGLYTLTLNLNDASLSQVNGSLCLLDSSFTANCQYLDPSRNGTYKFPHLVDGTYRLILDDQRYTVRGDTVGIAIWRADTTLSWQLVPRHFLHAGSVQVWQSSGSGDLQFAVVPDKPFTGELPVQVGLTWISAGGTASSSQITLPITNAALGSFQGQSAWRFSLTRNDVVQKIYQIDTSFGDRIQFKSVQLTTSVPGASGTVTNRTDAIAFPGANGGTSFWSNQSYSPFNAPSLGSWRMDRGGFATLKFNGFSTRHGTAGRYYLWLLGQNNSIESCDSADFGDTVSGASDLSFHVSGHAAYSLVSDVPQFVSGIDSKQGEFLQAPWGAAQAGGGWRVYSAVDTNAVVSTYAENPHNGLFNFSPSGVHLSLDSGRSSIASASVSKAGWYALGSIGLRKGWNQVSLATDSGVKLWAVSLRWDGSDETRALKSIKTIPDFENHVLTDSLSPDRTYRLQIVERDANGFSTLVVDSQFVVQPDGAFSDVSVEEQENGDLLVRSRVTALTTRPNLKVRLVPGTNPIAAQIDSTTDSSVTLRVLRSNLPSALLGSKGTGASPVLGPITLLWDSTFTVEIAYWVTHCQCHHHRQETRDATDSISIRWPAVRPWRSNHDYRSVPTPVETDLAILSDSIALRFGGMNLTDSAGTRGQVHGKLHIEWTPGSNCNPKSSTDLDFGNILQAGPDGRILFAPTFEGSWNSQVGAWGDTIRSRTARRQWLDLPQGGGFYPYTRWTSPLGDSAQPWIDYLIQSPFPRDTVYSLWVAPGSENTDSSQAFYWGMNSASNLLNQGAALASASDSWVAQQGPVVLHPGLNTLRIAMSQDGFALKGIALQDPNAPSPDPSLIANLPRFGLVGYDSVVLKAGGLAANTSHTFKISAKDRFGNQLDTFTIVRTTPQPALQVGGLRISASPWDSTGWIAPSTLQVNFSLDSILTGGVSPESVHALLLKFSRSKSQPDTIGTYQATSNSTGWGLSVSNLASWPTNTSEFGDGSNYELVAWGESSGARGPRSSLNFGVRAGYVPGQITGTISDLRENGVTFHPLHAWMDGALTLGDLQLAAFDRSEGDSILHRLVLRGAQLTLNSAGGGSWSLSHVQGGAFASERCSLQSGIVGACVQSSIQPWSLGRWLGQIPVDGFAYNSNSGLQVREADLQDDKGRVVASNPTHLTDAGIAPTDSLVMQKNRFWFRNVVASDTGDAFSIEACKTSLTQAADGTIHALTSGCTEHAGPFLVFDIVLETEGPDSWMGSAYDSMPTPFSLIWKQGVGYKVLDTARVTQTRLRNFSGASIWGYDIHQYRFDTAGVTLRDFDVILPKGKVFPGSKGVQQRVTGFAGVRVRSQPGVMRGMPVMDSLAVSSSATPLPFDSICNLSGMSGWTYSYVFGYGFALTPTPSAGGLMLNLPQPAGGSFHYTTIDAVGQGTDSLRIPVNAIAFGPGMFATLDASKNFTAQSGTVALSGTLSLTASEDAIQPNVTNTSISLADFFTVDDGTYPGTGYPVTATNASLGLGEYLGIKTVHGTGTFTSNPLPVVFTGGLPWLPFRASSFQLMQGNNDVLVSLNRPDAWFQLWTQSNSAEKANPSTWIHAAVFNSSRIPVAVGSKMRVPEDWQTLSIPGMASLGSLVLSDINFEAGVKSGTAYARMFGPATIELGTLFDKVGMSKWRLPLTNVGMEFQTSTSSLSSPIARVSDLQTGPLGLPITLHLTSNRIKSWFGETDNTSEGSKDYLRFYTGGNPITGRLTSNGAFDLGISKWNLQLTEDFPIEALRGLNFQLDTMGVEYSGDNLDLKVLSVSGSEDFDSLPIMPGFVLLPATGKKVTVSIGSEASNSSISNLKIELGAIRIGEKSYTVGCGDGNGYLSFRFDGKLEGQVCVTETGKIALYPLASTTPDVWIPESKTGTQLMISFSGSKLTLSVPNAHIVSSALPVIGALDLNGGISFSVSPKGLQLESAKVTSTKTYSQHYDPFVLGVKDISLRAFDTTLSSSTTAQRWFGISATPTFAFNSGASCNSNGEGVATFRAPIDQASDWKLTWAFGANLSCSVAGLKADAIGIKVTNNGPLKIGVDTLKVMVDVAKDFIANISSNGSLGIGMTDVSYTDDGHTGFHIGPAYPIGFNVLDNLHLEVPYVGVEVWAHLNFLPLFDSKKPGIAFDNVRVKLPSQLGGATFPTNFAVRLDGYFPYVHARGALKEIKLPIPAVKLTDAIQFKGAELALKFVEATENGKSDYWIFEGAAGLGIPGFISGIDVEMALKKPSPADCRTGVCKAVLTLEMKTMPIPLGTTGLYLAGLRGAFYDGSYVPLCAQDCGIMTLPNGMKFEFAILLQTKKPEVLNGLTGVWMQLNKLNFGIDGQFELLEGQAHAGACAAMYNNGSVFHGQFDMELKTSLWVKGGFYIDIWSDDHGKNLAAEADASVGLNRGSIIKCRFFKYPRHRSLFGPFVTRFGKFQSGSNGFVTGVRAIGKTWGVGYVDGGFRLGDVGRYKLAKPASSASLEEFQSMDPTEYGALPLGIELEGGEQITAIVATPEGTDWGGSVLHMVDSTQIGVHSSGFGGGAKSISTINLDPNLDTTNVEREDSLNFHRLTWSNYAHQGRVYFVVPRKVGTSTTTSTEEVSDPNIAKAWGDEQFILGLIPPTATLNAVPCSDSTICISGTVQNFRRSPRTIQRNLSSLEQTLGSAMNVDNSSQAVLLKQKNRMILYASRKEEKRGSVKSDSGASMEIPLDQVIGLPNGSSSLADHPSCVDTTGLSHGTITLNNCVWNTSNWTSGTYKLFASFQALNLLKNGDTIPESTTDDIVEVSRAPITRTDLPDSGFTWSHHRPILPVQGLAVYTSALDSGDHQGRNEKKSFFVRWVPRSNPDLGGYVVRWISDNNDSTDFAVGTTDHWSIDIPDPSAKSSTRFTSGDTTTTIATILDTTTNPLWYFRPPTAIRVLPFTMAETDTSTYFVKREDLAVTWTGSLQTGTAGTATTNLVGLSPTDTATRKIPLGSTDSVHLVFNYSNFSADTTALRSPTDYLSLELQWLDSLKRPISDTVRYLPSAGGPEEGWRITKPKDSVSVFIAPPERDVPCAAYLQVHDSIDPVTGKVTSMTDTTFRGCREGELLRQATPFGTYFLRVLGWNDGRRAPGSAAKVEIPVRITPPRPRIDNVETQYLLNGTDQDLTFRASRIWSKSGIPTLLKIQTVSGIVLDTIQLPLSDSSFFDSTLEVRWNGKSLPDLDIDTTPINLVLMNRAEVGGVESAAVPMELVKAPYNIQCKDSNLVDNVPHYQWAMDFVGFYPKRLHAGDSGLAVFSEIHAKNHLTLVTRLIHGGDTIVLPNRKTDWGVYFKVPETISGGSVRLEVGIPDSEINTSSNCKKSWGTNFHLLAPRGISSNSRRIEVALGRFRVHGLDSDESMNWSLGISNGFSVPPTHLGDTNWISINKTDYVHVVVSNKVTLVIDTVFLVQAPVQLSVVTTSGLRLQPVDSVLAGDHLQAISQPGTVISKAGASSLSLECRWNNQAWSACPADGWTSSFANSGSLWVRPVWGLHGRSDSTLRGSAKQWIVSLRGAQGYGWTTVPLTIPGSRLSRLLDSQAVRPVVTLRRKGTALPSWPAHAPVARDAQGAILPQQVVSYDPALKSLVLRIQVPRLVSGVDQNLQLWVGDTASAPSINEAGDLFASLPSDSIQLPASSGNGLALDVWFHWHGGSAILFRARDFVIQTDASGSLVWSWGHDTLRSLPQALDTLVDHQLGLSWSNLSGVANLTLNGRPIADGILRPGTNAGWPAVGAKLASGAWWLQWKARPVAPQEKRLAWESERPSSALWSPDPSITGTRVGISAISGRAFDTMGVTLGSRIWADREDTVASLSPAFSGAQLVLGQAADRADSSRHAAYWTQDQASEVCALSDSSWTGEPGWSRSSWKLNQWNTWCKMFPAGDVTLPGPRHGTDLGNIRGLSWVVRTVADGVVADSSLKAGDSLQGWTLSQVPGTLTGGAISLPTILGSGSKTVHVSGSGSVWVAVASGNPLQDSLLAHGWTRSGMTIQATGPSGQTVTLDVLYRPDGIVDGWVTWSTDPVFVIVTRGRSTSSTSDDPRYQSIPATGTVAAVFPSGDTVRFQNLRTDSIILPKDCSTRTWSKVLSHPALVWVSFPDDLGMGTMPGWTSSGHILTSGGVWNSWYKQVPAGPLTLDFSQVLDPGSCIDFVIQIQDLQVAPPSWSLDGVRVHALGGGRQAQGGLHVVRNLDLQSTASMDLKSQQYQLRLTSSSGWGSQLGTAVLGLGETRVVNQVDSASGSDQTVVVSQHWALSDLRADRLDADSVRVDAQTLKAKGTVRLTVTHHGGATFQSGLVAILFRDMNGNFRYDVGIDSVIGTRTLQSLVPGQSALLDFPVDGNRSYPEELFVAWVDAGAAAPEQQPGDHLAIGPSPCRVRKQTTWVQATSGLLPPQVSRGNFPGLDQALGVRLWDTNGDSVVDDQDTAQLLWIQAGRMWLARSGGDTIWTRPMSAASRPSDLAVRDVDGDGVPEIIAGNQVWTRTGTLLWDGQSLPGAPLDLADEGRTDSISVHGNCTEVWSGQRDLLWASVDCSRSGAASSLSGILRQPYGCSDASLSAPRLLLSGQGYSIRVANAGTVDQPGHLAVHLSQNGTAWGSGLTTRALHPGEWEDVAIDGGQTIPAHTRWDAWIETGDLTNFGILDSHGSNNRIEWGN
jgi:hypothetical protein